MLVSQTKSYCIFNEVAIRCDWEKLFLSPFTALGNFHCIYSLHHSVQKFRYQIIGFKACLQIENFKNEAKFSVKEISCLLIKGTLYHSCLPNIQLLLCHWLAYLWVQVWQKDWPAILNTLGTLEDLWFVAEKTLHSGNANHCCSERVTYSGPPTQIGLFDAVTSEYFIAMPNYASLCLYSISLL